MDALPESLETKSFSGHTPLSLAFNGDRLDAIDVLIGAGADQTIRDNQGRNIVHLAVCTVQNNAKSSASTIRALLSKIDSRLLPSLFLERCQEGPGSLTPLAYWLWLSTPCSDQIFFPNAKRNKDSRLEVIKTIIEFSKGSDLHLMDSSGQFPLHQAVKSSLPTIVTAILAHDPSLLWRENAMGQTPLELAENLFFQHGARGNPRIRPYDFGRRRTLIQDREPETFVRSGGEEGGVEEDDDEYDHSGVVKTYRVCRRFAAEYPGRRKLVSVVEAREVAKRLAERESEKEDYWGRRRGRKVGSENEEIGKDEVSRWLGI